MADIEIHSLNGTVDRDGDAKVIGMVTNNTDENLDLEVEVTFYKNGNFWGTVLITSTFPEAEQDH